MTRPLSILIVSDIHYAGAVERTRHHYEYQAIGNPLLRVLVRVYRHFIWLRDPLAHNGLFARVLAHPDPVDLVVANGDYSVDSAFVGMSDDAACASARECLEKMRARFPGRLHAVFGDHELGKECLFGHRGGLRLASWTRATTELGLTPCWSLELGCYRLISVVSSLAALPVYEPETLPEEHAQWRALREAHLAEVSRAFAAVQPGQRIVLFCHDPTALPFLAREEAVAAKLPQLELTVIGHLHSPTVLWRSRALAGMPEIRFLGNAVRRMSAALRKAKDWEPFKVRLCPSLTGIQCRKDGGYLTARLDPTGAQPVELTFQPLPW